MNSVIMYFGDGDSFGLTLCLLRMAIAAVLLVSDCPPELIYAISPCGSHNTASWSLRVPCLRLLWVWVDAT